ncbi:glycosyl hydrolase 108 family protein [Phenylobacterium sp.]|uniref:glycoside hydrolase family 108 protein n=1 Tax=Phenylobacterium sp. TaxID=1871053 RepID=UPI00286E968C|nr:glycosyl hydrolase 108 family protein [Phenylobacterium sp.]
MTSSERFQRCLPLILQHEGGYVDHRLDPGGATNLGVTLGTLSDWLKRPATKAEVKALTPAAVAPIYEANYWKAACCDKLPAGLDYAVFDLAVNSGPSRARKFLQRVAGVTVDGEVGPKTLAAVNALGSRAMIVRLNADREAFYRSLSTFPTFGKGWLRRLAEVTTKATAMAR